MHSMPLFSAFLTAVSVSSLQFSVLWNYVGKINFSGLFQTDNCNRDKAEYSNGGIFNGKPPRKIGKKHNVKKLGLQIVKLVTRLEKVLQNLETTFYLKFAGNMSKPLKAG